MDTRRIGQRELADLAQVSAATLRALQRGSGERRVRDSTLSAVSRALGLPHDHLRRVLLDQPLAERGCGPGGAVPGAGAQAEILQALVRIERHVELISRHVTPAA
jgi:hypothetical protein